MRFQQGIFEWIEAASSQTRLTCRLRQSALTARRKCVHALGKARAGRLSHIRSARPLTCARAAPESSRRMAMGLRHPKPADRISLEIEFNQHGGLVPDDPPVMPRLDSDHLRSFELRSAAVRVLNLELAAGEESNMRVHT